MIILISSFLGLQKILHLRRKQHEREQHFYNFESLVTASAYHIFSFSINTLSDLGDLNNLIGSLSRTIQQYSPPNEWIMCELGVFPNFLENDLLKVDKILELTFFFKARKGFEGFKTAFFHPISVNIGFRNIYLAASRLGKLQPLFTLISKNNCQLYQTAPNLTANKTRWTKLFWIDVLLHQKLQKLSVGIIFNSTNLNVLLSMENNVYLKVAKKGARMQVSRNSLGAPQFSSLT